MNCKCNPSCEMQTLKRHVLRCLPWWSPLPKCRWIIPYLFSSNDFFSERMPQETFNLLHRWNSCALFQLKRFKPFQKTISNSKTLGTNFDDINTWWVFSKVLTPRNQQVPSMLLWVKGCRWCKRWCNCRHFLGFLHAPSMTKYVEVGVHVNSQ